MSPLISRIQSNTQLYQRLKNELSEENGILLEIEDTSARRGLLTEKLNNLEAEVNTLIQHSKKEYSALHKARHFSVRSAAATLKGKKKALIAKEEAEYQLAFENEQRAKREMENIKTELNTIIDKENRLKQQADHLKNIRQQLNNLLEEVFYESNPSETLENRLRAELQNYVEQHALATHDLQRFRDTDHNLVQALRNITKTKELIKVTLNYVSFDLFGSSLIDDQQIIYVQGCQQSTWEVQRRLNVARQILPEIPYPASLDVVTNNHMLSLRFEGNYVDIAWQAKTQQAYNLLVSVEPAIRSAQQWVRDYLRYTEGAIQRLTATKETTHSALLNERMRIFDRVLSGNQGSVNGDELLSSSNNNNNIAAVQTISPPPVYTAPERTNTQPLQLPEISNVPRNNNNTNRDSLNINDINSSKHLMDPTTSSDSVHYHDHHLRTASQSSSIVGSPPSHPPSQPAAPSSYPYNNNVNSNIQTGPPFSPSSSHSYNSNIQNQSSVPSSSSSSNHLQNQPLPSSSSTNFNSNSNSIQSQPYLSYNENNPFRDTKHQLSDD